MSAVSLPRRRPLAWMLALTLLVGTLSTFLDIRPASALVVGDHELDFLRRVNTARTSRGLAPLKMARDLRGEAREHSGWMMRTGNFVHNATLATEITNWQMVGENIAVGWSVRTLHQALMQSPGHRANLLSPSFTQIGIGVHVDDSGKLWVTQVFRKPW